MMKIIVKRQATFCSKKKIKNSVKLQVILHVLKRFDADKCACEIASVLSVPDLL
jgi:hypothetical protein